MLGGGHSGAATAAHAGQTPPAVFCRAVPIEAFREASGAEWFIRRDAPDIRENWLFDGL